MPVFDGDNLIMTLDAPTDGVLIIDTEIDLYSEWKKWQLLDDNLRYEKAFDTAAGDELTTTSDIGAYFFSRNDLGWRIRPHESDHTIYLTGNLVPRNSSLPLVIPTIGGYTVLVLGLQPVTQNVDDLIPNMWTESLTEDYPVDGQSAATPAQILYSINQMLSEFARSGTTVSIKKRDGTEAFQLTLDSATNPTSSTQSS